MATVLHLDSSARPGVSGQQPHGSHSRRLSARFIARWRMGRPQDAVVYRDVGQTPPGHVTDRWIHAAFTAPARREPWMNDVLAESDALVDELLGADLIVAGVPMYNFSVPSQFKAYIDNIVRVGRTFGFDRSRTGEPYWPLLAEARKKLVILSSRGDFGYGEGERLEAMNHVEPSIRSAFGYIGITDMASVAVEYDEFGGERLKESLARAEARTDVLVARMQHEWTSPLATPNALPGHPRAAPTSGGPSGAVRESRTLV